MEPDEWKVLVGDPIKDRRQLLGIRSMRRAALAAGFSEAVWRQIETGRRQIARGNVIAPTPTEETKAAAARALGWTSDSIDRLLRHEPPVELAADPDALRNGHGGSEGWPAWLEDWLRQEIRSVRDAVAAVAQRVGDLESRLKDPPA